MAVNIVKTYRNIGTKQNPKMSGYVYETTVDAVKMNKNSDKTLKQYLNEIETGSTNTTNFTTDLKNKLDNIEEEAQKNVQSNWNETDSTSDSFIQNKPTIPNKISQLTNDSGFVTTDTNTTYTLIKNGNNIILKGSDNTQSSVNDSVGSSSGSSVTIDDDFYENSTNPVQSKVILGALQNHAEVITNLNDHVANVTDKNITTVSNNLGIVNTNVQSIAASLQKLDSHMHVFSVSGSTPADIGVAFVNNTKTNSDDGYYLALISNNGIALNVPTNINVANANRINANEIVVTTLLSTEGIGTGDPDIDNGERNLIGTTLEGSNKPTNIFQSFTNFQNYIPACGKTNFYYDYSGNLATTEFVKNNIFSPMILVEYNITVTKTNNKWAISTVTTKYNNLTFNGTNLPINTTNTEYWYQADIPDNLGSTVYLYIEPIVINISTKHKYDNYNGTETEELTNAVDYPAIRINSSIPNKHLPHKQISSPGTYKLYTYEYLYGGSVTIND